MRKFSLIQLVLVVAVSLAAYAPAFAGSLDVFKGESGVLKISGGTAHIPVMKDVAKKIMVINPDIQISIAGGGSGVGIKQVGEGLVDIGNSGRIATEEEISRYQLNLYKWAIDGVAPVVHPNNPVKALTKTQMIDIFSGKLDNWKMLGGADRKINVYTRDEASGTRAVFWKKGLDKAQMTTGAHVVVSNGAMKSAIAQDPYGVGYVSVGHIDASVAPVALDGVVPTIESVQDGSFKIARGLYSNTKGEPHGLTKKFIDFLYTTDGKKIIEQRGFIPVR
ncbi:phosphate ABC transporter, periplasmic phosphate-binding protein [Syntrophotalea carbinolica DSM 2380]|uniref:Phosphate ABC transporter, periplasmic phosphate-binding protein n=1 Tax=Syntrophotalea carbinolica (strain DSM 2380 / NBRC 103641 / GraBd1) TaxID=338963 RepID=Q3A6C4_SYNC1|nr:phosphate ABC transporter substrate-binding protein [Syntrophotalea carbinolica]ABA88083.1 phosphate ABC transporter, periplasmic phosphate-binding protein [Syntrophotalea carbinolica DSM 2380]